MTVSKDEPSLTRCQQAFIALQAHAGATLEQKVQRLQVLQSKPPIFFGPSIQRDARRFLNACHVAQVRIRRQFERDEILPEAGVRIQVKQTGALNHNNTYYIASIQANGLATGPPNISILCLDAQ